MFKLKYKQLNDAKFIEALGKLSKMPLPVQMAYNIGKIHSKILRELDHARELFKKIMEEFSVRDPETKQIVLEENGLPKIDETKKAEREKAAEEFLAIEFEIPHLFPTMAQMELSGVKLSGEDLQAFDAIWEQE